MPKITRVSVASAGERHEVKRKVGSRRRMWEREYKLLPVRTIVGHSSETEGTVTSHKRVQYKHMLYMAELEGRIDELKRIEEFIRGMAKRDNRRPGGAGIR